MSKNKKNMFWSPTEILLTLKEYYPKLAALHLKLPDSLLLEGIFLSL